MNSNDSHIINPIKIVSSILIFSFFIQINLAYCATSERGRHGRQLESSTEERMPPYNEQRAKRNRDVIESKNDLEEIAAHPRRAQAATVAAPIQNAALTPPQTQPSSTPRPSPSSSQSELPANKAVVIDQVTEDDMNFHGVLPNIDPRKETVVIGYRIKGRKKWDIYSPQQTSNSFTGQIDDLRSEEIYEMQVVVVKKSAMKDGLTNKELKNPDLAAPSGPILEFVAETPVASATTVPVPGAPTGGTRSAETPPPSTSSPLEPGTIIYVPIPTPGSDTIILPKPGISVEAPELVLVPAPFYISPLPPDESPYIILPDPTFQKPLDLTGIFVPNLNPSTDNTTTTLPLGTPIYYTPTLEIIDFPPPQNRFLCQHWYQRALRSMFLHPEALVLPLPRGGQHQHQNQHPHQPRRESSHLLLSK